MKETGIETTVPAGRVDKALNVIEGNNYLYELMGDYVYFSFYKMVREDETEKLSKAVEKCSYTAEHCAEELIHIQNEEEEYESYIISIRQCEETECYYIELFNMSEDREKVEYAGRQMALARDYLTLNGDFMSEYHAADDSFRLFWLNHEQTVELFRMGFAEWKEQMLCGKRINEGDESIFASLCEAMMKTEDIQTYHFKSSIFSGGEHMEMCRVKLMQRKYDEDVAVIGMWSIILDSREIKHDKYIEDANVDSLTRLLNKKSMNDYVKHAIEKGEKQLAIVMMDVDNFKNVNDTYGHLFGDQVLKAVADVVKTVIGKKGMAGRIGGDEFMFVLEDYEDEVNLRNYLRSIKVNVAALFRDKMGSNGLSCSIGVSRSDVDAGDFKELVKTADKALYIAKQKGKNRYIIYKQELHGQLKEEDGDDMLNIRQSYYSDADIKQINRLLSEVVLHGKSGIPALLERAAETLLVDRIVIFWGMDGKKPIASYHAEGEAVEAEADILKEKQYLESFQDNLCLISNVYNLEYSMSGLYTILKQAKVCSSMQYLLRDKAGNMGGLILADECKTIRSFPQVAVRIFENMCEILQGVLLREEN